MKRPTRVPASSVVRMKSASNMIAKWYQSAERRRRRARARRCAPCRPRGSARRRCARTACARRSRARASPSARGVDREAPARDRRGRRGRVGADHAGRAVDREVDAGLRARGRDHRHDGDERLHQHRAVADHRRVGLLAQQLRRGAGGDQRVEARDRAAGDRDEAEREDLAGEDRAGAVDEARERRHLDLRAAARRCRPRARRSCRA